MENNEHVNGLKESIDHIIGVGTVLKPKKTNKQDKNKEEFEQMILTLESLNTKSNLLSMEFGIDLSSHEELFYNIIDNLIKQSYGEECASLISFYIYDRINEDGSINDLIEEQTQQTLKLESPSDLWFLIQAFKEKQNGGKKGKSNN